MLIASNYAGIAFGNAGVGAVHALSYPLGGNYHVPHGEANYQFFTEVFKLYCNKMPEGCIQELNRFLSEGLRQPECVSCKSATWVYEALDDLLANLTPRNPLRTYGMTEEDIDGFTGNVLLTQQRLLTNNYAPFTKDEIRHIYASLY